GQAGAVPEPARAVVFARADDARSSRAVDGSGESPAGGRSGQTPNARRLAFGRGHGYGSRGAQERSGADGDSAVPRVQGRAAAGRAELPALRRRARDAEDARPGVQAEPAAEWATAGCSAGAQSARPAARSRPVLLATAAQEQADAGVHHLSGAGARRCRGAISRKAQRSGPPPELSPAHAAARPRAADQLAGCRALAGRTRFGYRASALGRGAGLPQLGEEAQGAGEDVLAVSVRFGPREVSGEPRIGS